VDVCGGVVGLQVLGDCEADLATATCDEDNLVIESHRGRYLSFIES